MQEEAFQSSWVCVVRAGGAVRKGKVAAALGALHVPARTAAAIAGLLSRASKGKGMSDHNSKYLSHVHC
jgi:hypothetical protein